MQAKYLRNVFLSWKSWKKLPLFIIPSPSPSSFWNILLSKVPARSNNNSKPMPPPTIYATCQLATGLPIIDSIMPPSQSPWLDTKKAATAPKAPKVTIIIVPIPRFLIGINSATKVIAAPSSPASPKPAMKRHILYAHSVVTNAFAILATL